MNWTRKSNRINIGDMVRGRESNKLYLVVKINDIFVDYEFIPNSHPYVLVDVVSMREHKSFASLSVIEKDYVLEARNDDMTIKY